MGCNIYEQSNILLAREVLVIFNSYKDKLGLVHTENDLAIILFCLFSVVSVIIFVTIALLLALVVVYHLVIYVYHGGASLIHLALPTSKVVLNHKFPTV